MLRNIYCIAFILFFALEGEAQVRVTASRDSVCPGECVTLTDSSNGRATYLWSTGATTSTVVVCPNVTTIYTVITTDSIARYTNTIRIVVIPLPGYTLTGATRVCIGTPDTLHLYASNGGHILWCSGDTSNTYITGNMEADSIICFKVANVLGCGIDTSLVIDTMSCPLGINEINNSVAYKIYPNPGSGVFTLQSSVSSGQWSVEVYNELGQLVYNKTLRCARLNESFKQAQGDNTINISGQPNGVYFYRVLFENGELLGQGKLVIER